MTSNLAPLWSEERIENVIDNCDVVYHQSKPSTPFVSIHSVRVKLLNMREEYEIDRARLHERIAELQEKHEEALTWLAQERVENYALRSQVEAIETWENKDVYRAQESVNRGPEKSRLVINITISNHLITMEDSEGNKLFHYLSDNWRLQRHKQEGER